jgi:1-acyl-sn-glycerol-3-phosphate acyltransferase
LDPLQTLTRINQDDLLASFGWKDRTILSRLLIWLLKAPARKFARQMIEFDQTVGDFGLVHGSSMTLRHFVQDVRIHGNALPAGPFLALSNHPGMTDTLSLFCALDRTDLKIIALDRPFLNALPNTSRHLFYLQEDAASRIGLVRQASSHLRSGGALLTFPAGRIEPDPDIYDGAVNSLRHWVDSAGVFLRMAPEIAILPVLVRSVVWDRMARHPLLAIKKTREEREILAAAFQLLSHVIWNRRPVIVRVQIGRPLYAMDLGGTNPKIIHSAVITEMEKLILEVPRGMGRSVMY